MTRQVVVLAGGLGTRMLPRTESTPKYLLPVAGRPFAFWQLERLAACGYDDVILSVGHLGEAIRDAVGDGRSLGLSVRYVDEGDTPRGTGGALVLARDRGVLAPELLVTYGDSYLPFDYYAPLERLSRSPELSGVMSVFRNQGRFDRSNVALSADGTRVARYEKGSSDPALDCIDYGAMALRRSVIEEAPSEPFGLELLQSRLAGEGRLGAVLADERFYEIGSSAGLADLEQRLLRGTPD
jgi:N-acetyl-alpha-D-muramate 1-phosphate uridylyltransferase